MSAKRSVVNGSFWYWLHFALAGTGCHSGCLGPDDWEPWHFSTRKRKVVAAHFRCPGNEIQFSDKSVGEQFKTINTLSANTRFMEHITHTPSKHINYTPSTLAGCKLCGNSRADNKSKYLFTIAVYRKAVSERLAHIAISFSICVFPFAIFISVLAVCVWVFALGWWADGWVWCCGSWAADSGFLGGYESPPACGTSKYLYLCKMWWWCGGGFAGVVVAFAFLCRCHCCSSCGCLLFCGLCCGK